MLFMRFRLRVPNNDGGPIVGLPSIGTRQVIRWCLQVAHLRIARLHQAQIFYLHTEGLKLSGHNKK